MPIFYSEVIDFFAELHNLGACVSKLHRVANPVRFPFKNLFDGGRTGLDLSNEVLASGNQFTN